MDQKQFEDMATAKVVFVENACRQAGLKLTHQRMQIMRHLAVATDHPSAERLFLRVREKMPTISLDTVYRTLATFDKLGLILKLSGAGAQTHYDPALFAHHHFLCIECGTITDFDWTDFDKLPTPPAVAQWGSVKDKQVVLRGICRACQQ